MNFEFCFDDNCSGAVVITIRDSTFHRLLLMLFINGWFFSIFIVMVFGKNLSLQYVKFMNCTL